jgi:beta-lactamase class D
MKKILLNLALIIILFTNVLAQKTKVVDLKSYLENYSGCFVLLDNKTGEYLKYNEERCAERFLPASTFKIPNALIGLETGGITDENFVIKWDGIERSIKEWNKDQTLATAMQFSVVPYFQELARGVGEDAMKSYLNKFDYGNKTIGENIERFWLDNSLKISADEQIEFLKKFYNYQLPISKRSIDIVKKILSQEKYEKSILKFKTGTGNKQGGTWIGWLVGFVEKENNVFFFVLNIEGKTYDEVKQLRDTKSREILKYLKVIE